jgi:hypothetical protein
LIKVHLKRGGNVESGMSGPPPLMPRINELPLSPT